MKRLLSIMLALMLVLSMAATAFATEQTKAGEAKATEIKVTKTYNDPVGYGAKFFFDVTQTYPDPMSGTNTAPTLTIAPFSFAADHANAVETAEKLVKIENLRGAGTFKYTVKERQTWGDPTSDTVPITAPDLKGGEMTMSKAEYEVTVTITEPKTGEFAIESVVAKQLLDDAGQKPSGDGKVEELTFVNTYAKEAGDLTDDTLGSLRIDKTVVNPLTVDQNFSFILEYTYPAGGNPFTVNYTHSGHGAVTPNPNGTSAKFTLKGGEYVVVTGLPIGTVVNVEESATTGFTPSASVQMGGGTPAKIDSLSVSDGLMLSDHLTSDLRTLREGKNVVGVTNTRDTTPPMGVILNVLPYVLMVAIAGGMIVLFTVIKRRKAQDYED